MADSALVEEIVHFRQRSAVDTTFEVSVRWDSSVCRPALNLPSHLIIFSRLRKWQRCD